MTRRRAGRGLDTIAEPPEDNAHELAQGWLAQLEESGNYLSEAVGRDPLLDHLGKCLLQGCPEAGPRQLISNCSHTHLESAAP